MRSSRTPRRLLATGLPLLLVVPTGAAARRSGLGGDAAGADGPNLLTYLPAALKHYPDYAAPGDQAAHDAIIAAGFAPGSSSSGRSTTPTTGTSPSGSTERSSTRSWDGALDAGVPFCPSGSTPSRDADYDYSSRPQAVKDAVRSVQLTGRIGKPLLTVHGTLDTLLSCARAAFTALTRWVQRGTRPPADGYCAARER